MSQSKHLVFLCPAVCADVVVSGGLPAGSVLYSPGRAFREMAPCPAAGWAACAVFRVAVPRGGVWHGGPGFWVLSRGLPPSALVSRLLPPVPPDVPPPAAPALPWAA